MNLLGAILMMMENERAKKRVCVNEKSKLAKAKARERSGSERNLFFCVCVCGEYGGYFGPRVKI